MDNEASIEWVLSCCTASLGDEFRKRRRLGRQGVTDDVDLQLREWLPGEDSNLE
ncbi:MAG: hypothetical protein HOI29_07265 [Planctomycetes bacterium]|nr:hypothetical protein [Planctomycetota bacterium]MBT6453276.1 hypothetical protein [Planctomycetota bacterium]MBT6968138.1 hypothetical protein [Planctomycetota bacterium]MBT7638954.1 hypothetical protein [Planctomycetota bacterium]